MEILTAGSSQSSAAEIYQRLEEHQSTSVVHIRANANSRLGGIYKSRFSGILSWENFVNFLHSRTFTNAKEFSF